MSVDLKTKYARHNAGWVNPDKGIDFKGSPSKTIQSEKDACDINVIMARYEKTGTLPDPMTGIPRQPMFGDFSNVGDYHQIKTRVARAEEAFAALPAGVRGRFDNDVQKLADFLVKDENLDEAIELGLREKPQGWVSKAEKEAAAKAAAEVAARAAGSSPAAGQA